MGNGIGRRVAYVPEDGTHYHLRFATGDEECYVNRQDAERAREVHHQYGDDPEIVEVTGQCGRGSR